MTNILQEKVFVLLKHYSVKDPLSWGFSGQTFKLWCKNYTCFSLKLEFIGRCNCMIKLKQPAIISFESLDYIVQKVHMCMHVNIIFKFSSEYMFVLFGSMKITQKSFTWIKLTMVTHTRPISIMWKVFDAGINKGEKNTVGKHNRGCISRQGIWRGPGELRASVMELKVMTWLIPIKLSDTHSDSHCCRRADMNTHLTHTMHHFLSV